MWLRIALFGTLLTPVLHIFVLIANGLDPVVTPISELSRQKFGEVHSVGLVSFGLANIALAIAMGKLDRGRLWPVARALLLASGLVLFYVAYYFVTGSESVLGASDANDPLWIVASLIGTAMGAIQPGLSRIYRPLGLFSALCLGIFFWLMPTLFFVNASWLGAYERIVGSIYVIWMAGVALGMIRYTNTNQDQQTAPA